MRKKINIEKDRPKNAILTIILIILLLLVIIAIYYSFIETLGFLDLSTIIIFPIILSILVEVISQKVSGDDLSKNLNLIKTELIINLGVSKVPCHGSVETIQGTSDPNSWWLNKLLGAEREFTIIGRSNKHWIRQGGDEQLKIIGENMLRILENNGSVTILSKKDDKTKTHTKQFIEKYVLERIKERNSDQKAFLIERVKSGFKYIVMDDMKYNALIYDGKIIIMPTLNSYDFREDAIVLELSKELVPLAYKNYKDDIMRTINSPTQLVFPKKNERMLNI